MKAVVNGESMELDDSITGIELLARLGIPASVVVVELNGEVVKREEFLERRLADGDALELLTVVGGG